MSTERDMNLRIPVPGTVLEGNLVLPDRALGVVTFVHGNDRHGVHEQALARALHQKEIGTLRVGLLTPTEQHEDRTNSRYRFDIGLLAGRLMGITDWLGRYELTRALRIGYFGTGTGGAAALVAAAARPNEVAAVVIHSGRPDLADEALPHVRAPTLLIVGGRDESVVELNRRAMASMRCKVQKIQLAIVPGASHLFEEPGTLDEAARLACDWFAQYLPRPSYESSTLWW